LAGGVCGMATEASQLMRAPSNEAAHEGANMSKIRLTEPKRLYLCKTSHPPKTTTLISTMEAVSSYIYQHQNIFFSKKKHQPNEKILLTKLETAYSSNNDAYSLYSGHLIRIATYMPSYFFSCKLLHSNLVWRRHVIE
jgi:hypothetical protein